MDIQRKLSSLVEDVDKSFWNGKGNIRFGGDVARALAADPELTIGGIREEHPDYAATGVSFEASSPNAITLGEPRGSDHGFSISLDGNVGFWIHFFQSLRGLGELDDEDSLRRVLERFVSAVDSDSGLMALDFTGKINGGLAMSRSFSSVNANVNIGAGAAYRWSYCRPTKDRDTVIGTVGRAFSRARLPQTDLEGLESPTMLEGELLMTRHLGYFNLDADVSWGYEFSGSKDYAIGAMDLTTRLTVAASAKLSLEYSLAGEFQTVVLRGSSKDFLRVVVEKDRSSAFGIGLGIVVKASLDTPGIPEDGVKLFESMLGTTTPQILQEVRNLADLDRKGLRRKANGFIRSVVGKWTGKAFEKLRGAQLDEVLEKFRMIRDQIEGIDDRLLSIYEQHLGDPMEEWIDEVESFFEPASNFSAQDFVEKFAGAPQVGFLEKVTGSAFSELFVALDQRRDEILAKVLDPIAAFRTLVTSDVEAEIRGFVEAKLEVLGIRAILDEARDYDTPEKLEQQATDRVQEFVGRLFDRTWAELVEDGELGDVIEDLQEVVNNFESLLDRLADVIETALHAKGRFEISTAYRKVEERESLIDIEFDVSSHEGRRLFDSALEGRWGEVLRNENLRHLRLHEAAFTDKLETTKTLEIHIFGWNYKSVVSVVDLIDSKIEVGPDGLVTVYNLRVDGRRTTTTEDRETELSYALQVASRIAGAFERDELEDQNVDPLKALRLNQNAFKYEVRDEFTDLDELGTYLNVGMNLGVLDSEDADGLNDSIVRLRGESNYLADTLGRIELRYAVSYPGELLAGALFWDQPQSPVPVWAARRRHHKNVTDYKEALGHIFADRVVAGHRFSDPLRRIDLVPLLYSRGMYGALLRHGQLSFSKMLGFLEGFEERRQFNEPLALHANALYQASQRFAATLDELRQAANSKDLTIKRFRKLVRQLIEKLDRTARGEGVDGYGVSLLFLDALVQRYLARERGGSTPAESEGPKRTALLEISLFEAGSDEPVERIAVAG